MVVEPGSVDTRTGIRTRSDQFVTSGALLPAVHVSPDNWKVVRPRGSQRGSHLNMMLGIPGVPIVVIMGPCRSNMTAPALPSASKPGPCRLSIIQPAHDTLRIRFEHLIDHRRQQETWTVGRRLARPYARVRVTLLLIRSARHVCGSQAALQECHGSR